MGPPFKDINYSGKIYHFVQFLNIKSLFLDAMPELKKNNWLILSFLQYSLIFFKSCTLVYVFERETNTIPYEAVIWKILVTDKVEVNKVIIFLFETKTFWPIGALLWTLLPGTSWSIPEIFQTIQLFIFVFTAII